ncbi:hypothetical protein F5X96DRAFT_655974, partial [Biscogniauxia mediterranea]
MGSSLFIFLFLNLSCLRTMTRNYLFQDNLPPSCSLSSPLFSSKKLVVVSRRNKSGLKSDSSSNKTKIELLNAAEGEFFIRHI